MQEWLIQLIGHYPHIVYGLIILVTFVEGPILAILCGLLIHLGYLPFIPAYIALMVGDLLGDVIWYSLGYNFGHRFIARFGKYFSITEKSVTSVERIFRKYSSRILIISKLTMGFGFAVVTLFTAGFTKIPFRKYMALNFAGQFFWTALLLAIGYFFGHVYTSVDNIIGKISVGALFVIAFLALLGYGKYIKNNLTKITEKQ